MIVCTDSLPSEAIKILSEWRIDGTGASKDALEKDEVLMSWGGVSNKLLSSMKSLRAIQLFSAGAEDLNFSLIPPNVSIFSNAGAYSSSATEHAWALLLTLAKDIKNRGKSESYQLLNKNLLVLGCGSIGSSVAVIAKAFGMRTVGLSRRFSNPEAFDEKYDLESLEDHLEISDAIVCSLPLTKHTQNLLDYDRLSHLKTKVILVNISRAEIFDQNAVFKILSERPATRFATDVFWRRNGAENFDSRLWSLENFVGTMHSAGARANVDVANAAKLRAAENLREYLKTGRANNKVRREDYV